MPLFRRRKPQGVPFDPTAGDPRAARLVEGVEADDLDAVKAVLGEPAPHEVRERLLSLMTDVSGHHELFDRWVEAEPDRQLAWLARGAYGVGYAWEARGGDYADKVGRDAFELFFERLNVAEDDLMRAADMDRDDPVPWSNLLVSGRGLQVPKEELRIRYEEVQKRHPWLVEANMQMLQSLCEKWFGSDEESLEFARATNRDAPEGAAARAVLPMAHIEIWLDKERREGEFPHEYRQSREVLEEIWDASKRSVLVDGFTDDLTTAYALNVFAMALNLFGDEVGAKAIVQRLGTRRTEFPWVYLADPDGVYGELLASS